MTKITKEFIEACLEMSDNEHSKLTEREIEIFGLSSKRQRAFINNICSKVGTKYLEIGVYRGATLLAAAAGNSSTKVVGIENFSYDDREPAKKAPVNGIWDNMKSQLYDNISRYKDPDSSVNTENVTIIEEDYRKADLSSIKDIDVCLFDVTPTSDRTHKNFVELVLPSLSDESVIIFTQYSNSATCKLIDNAIEESSELVEVLYEQNRVSGGLSDSTKYFSGLAIFLLKKKVKKVVMPKISAIKK